MKYSQLRIRLSSLLAAGLLITAASTQADNYIGNGNNSFFGAIGNGVLSLSDNGTNFNGSLTVGGIMTDTLVIYFDTGAGGGFSSTAGFNDQYNDDGSRMSISGVSGSGRSVLTFTNGFRPQYAIALGPTNNNFGGLYQLANGGNDSLTYLGSVNLNPVDNGVGPFTFSFPATAIGLTNHVKSSLRLFGTYISNTGFRSAEAIAGNLYCPYIDGWQPFNQTAYASYTFANFAKTNYPVVFSVDLTAQISDGAFKPLSGDTVYAAGSFQSMPWSGFQLVPSAGNTNIYSGTNQDYNSPGIAELYKFRFHSFSGNYDVWEFGSPDENRPYTTLAAPQILPLVYFNDYAASPSATTNAEIFQVDMGAQITLGQFNPATEQVEAFGTFENPQWFSGFILTNNPAGPTPTLFSGTFKDGNYPGTWQQFKFVVVSNANDTYEYINNRTFYTPQNAGTLSLAYFNNISPYSTLVTFKVDMTLPLLNGSFNPSAGDTVGAAGTFETNQWAVGGGGFLLTNNPEAANSNLYSGTYPVFDQPGTGEYYKFVINNSGGSTTFELPVSTGGGNREFALVNPSQTLPAVYWQDDNPINYLSENTLVTFTVNMTNAVDLFGNPFDQNNDLVMVDGDFTSPQWPVMSDATDPLINSDYPQNVLDNNPPGSPFFQVTFLVPAGNPLVINYKYGIYHNTANLNTNVDNEAYYGQNHTRYIRGAGSYNLPADIFGIQRTDPAAAVEPAFGSLAIGGPVAGKLPITWLGLPSVHLQTCTNLSNGVWLDLNATTGLNSTNWTPSGKNSFFRLIQL